MRFPDDSFKSQTEIHNFRTALARVAPQFGKPDGIRKSCPSILKSRKENGNSSRKFSKSDRILDFRPAFSADLLDAGEPLKEVSLNKPPGKKGYVMEIPVKGWRPIYIKLQLGSGQVFGRSFHHSNG